MTTESNALVTDANAQAAFTEEVAPNVNNSLNTPAPTPTSNGYTVEDLNKVRETEKQKLYPQIESLKTELDALKKAKDARDMEDNARLAQMQADAKKKEEEGMDLRTLLETKEKEWASRLEQERKEREAAFALVERERKFSELNEYRNRRVNEERENIIPEMLDLIAGETPDEVETSIAGLKAKTASILESVRASKDAARKEMKGVSTTFPADGPLDNNSGQQSFTPEDIKAMSNAEFAKHRARLLGSGANANGKGLFG